MLFGQPRRQGGRAVLVLLGLGGRLRPFDPIVRWSEKEFVCTLAEVDPEEARRWLSDMCSEIGERHPGEATTIGVASSLEGDDETLEGLVEQAGEQPASS